MIERLIAIVLYEDSRARGHAGDTFGPHHLLCRAVADVLGEELDAWLVKKRLAAIPMKGAEKVIRVCREEFERFQGRADHLVVVLDDDVLRSKLHASEREDLAVAFRRCVGIGSADRLHLVRLAANMETLLASVAGALGEPGHPVLHGKKPRPNERDRLCMRAAAAARTVRERILDEVPSFRDLRDLVVRLWMTSPG